MDVMAFAPKIRNNNAEKVQGMTTMIDFAMMEIVRLRLM